LYVVLVTQIGTSYTGSLQSIVENCTTSNNIRYTSIVMRTQRSIWE